MACLAVRQITKCYFCNGNHLCRDCPKEKMMAPYLKNLIGNTMEHWVAHNIRCPECNCNELCVLGSQLPSLDIICKSCLKKYEVKSKCLSDVVIPNNIIIMHGAYDSCIQRLDDGLGLFLIIYGIDRKRKLINIREVLYANNSILKNPSIIKIEKRQTRTCLSTIIISDRTKIQKICTHVGSLCLSFQRDYDELCSKIL